MIRITHELENGNLMLDRQFDTYEEFIAAVNSGELDCLDDEVKEESEDVQ